MPWYRRWRNVFRPERLNAELDKEFQYHLAESTDRLMAEGMPREEALRTARRRLGNYSIQKESTRDMNIAAWLDSTRADVAYGLRQLKLNPGFTAIAVLSLALGIGANAAIFQLVNAIRLKTLPVRNPQELVLIDFENGSVRHGSGGVRTELPATRSGSKFEIIKRHSATSWRGTRNSSTWRWAVSRIMREAYT